MLHPTSNAKIQASLFPSEPAPASPRSSAVLSADGLCRYRLSREMGHGFGRLLVIGLNPSKADAVDDDQTVRVLRGLALRLGCAWLDIGNLFALRSTDPKVLYTAADPVGPENDAHLLDLARDARVILAAWGNHGAFQARDKRVVEFLRSKSIRRLTCLALTKGGHPHHPLRLSGALLPVPFEVRA